MSNLEDVVYAAMTGGRTRREGEPIIDMVREIHAEFGSAAAAARYAGIPATSWRRYERGGSPRETNTERITRASRSLRAADDIPTDRDVVIHTKDRQNERPRILRAHQLKLRPGTMDRVREAYLRGDDQAAAAAFLDGIGEPWYKQWLTPGSPLAERGSLERGAGGPVQRGEWIRSGEPLEEADYTYDYGDVYDAAGTDTDSAYGATVSSIY